jgi:tRNA1Val (adenine37-N6)-methyltransferase
VTTEDALFGGRLRLAQPARGEGYRANVDALLLAAFARRPGSQAKVAFDLGSGVGTIALALLHWNAVARVVLLEADATAAALAGKNLAANRWSERGEVVHADVERAARERKGEAQLVVCNPPYVAPGRGRAAQGFARARARGGDLTAFTSAARAVLGRRGRACFVYPAGEALALVDALREAGLEPKRMRHVHGRSEEPARIVLVEAMPAKPGGLVIEAPITERDGGEYTPELRALLAGD